MRERGEIREGEGTTTQNNINSQGGVAGATRDGNNGLISSTLVNICVIIGFAAFAYTVKCVLKAVDNSQDYQNLGLIKRLIHRVRITHPSLRSSHLQENFLLFSEGKIYNLDGQIICLLHVYIQARKICRPKLICMSLLLILKLHCFYLHV